MCAFSGSYLAPARISAKSARPTVKSKPNSTGNGKLRQNAPPNTLDVVEWDVANWSEALLFWRAHSSHAVTDVSRALELGARNGGLSLWLAFLGFRVVCSDVEEPGAKARALHAAYKLSSRIEYRSINATAISAHGQFDVVSFKSVLGAVGRGGYTSQEMAVSEMHRVLRPGGEVWFAENLVASPLHRWLRLCFVPWSSSWRYLTAAELRSLFSQFADFEMITVGFFGAFGRTEQQRRLLSYLDRAIPRFLIPSGWRYIGIGIARK